MPVHFGILLLRTAKRQGQNNLPKGDIARLLSISSVMAAILNLIEPEIAPFDPPTLKTLS